MFNAPYLDLHTHHPSGATDALEIESVYFGQSPGGKTPWFSAGLHPRYLQNIDFQEAESWLRGMIVSPHCVFVGEAGLDKATETPFNLQLEAFRLCVALSEEARKPLVIHCVRAFSEVLAVKKDLRPRCPWIFHGFEKNAQTARMLTGAGCYLSFGGALLRPRSHAPESLRQTPPDRYFLETDDRDIDIRAVYERAAHIRGEDVKEIRSQAFRNFQNVRS